MNLSIKLLLISLFVISACCKDDNATENNCESSINVKFLNETHITVNKIDLFGISLENLALETFSLSSDFQFETLLDTVGYYDLRIFGNDENGTEVISSFGNTIACGNEDTLSSDLSNNCYILVLDRIDTLNVFCSNSLYAYWVQE